MKKRQLKTTLVMITILFCGSKAMAQYRNSNSYRYNYAVQQQANSGQYNVCINTPTQYTYGGGANVGYGGGGINGQVQQSYSVNQWQCGQGYLPQQGQQFYVNYGYGNRTMPLNYNNNYNTPPPQRRRY